MPNFVPGVYLPSGYASEPVNATVTFNNQTFITLGLTPGSYSSGFNSGADTITIQVGQPVPEPLTLLGASAAVAFGAVFKRRHQG